MPPQEERPKPRLTKYERKRERKIREFQALLKELGIEDLREKMRRGGRQAGEKKAPVSQSTSQLPGGRELPPPLTLTEVREKWPYRQSEIDHLVQMCFMEASGS